MTWPKRSKMISHAIQSLWEALKRRRLHGGDKTGSLTQRILGYLKQPRSHFRFQPPWHLENFDEMVFTEEG